MWKRGKKGPSLDYSRRVYEIASYDRAQALLGSLPGALLPLIGMEDTSSTPLRWFVDAAHISAPLCQVDLPGSWGTCPRDNPVQRHSAVRLSGSCSESWSNRGPWVVTEVSTHSEAHMQCHAPCFFDIASTRDP